MASTVRIELTKKNQAVQELKKNADDAWNYIDGEMTKLINSFSSWWIGDAYEAFKVDFQATKAKFRKEIYEECLAYNSNLDKAVCAQSQQDTSNAKSIGIN